MSTEDSAKKYIRKMEALMAEMAEEMIDDSARKGVEDKLKAVFQQGGIPFGTKEIKAFYEGVTMGAAAAMNDKDVLMPLMMVLRMMINKNESAISKAADDAVEKLMNNKSDGTV